MYVIRRRGKRNAWEHLTRSGKWTHDTRHAQAWPTYNEASREAHRRSADAVHSSRYPHEERPKHQ